ncbi:hypothetical protein MW887_001153 [Aspergillus wentii]|nr:hypothetical protein MW887_001153 [Aspergillus wentii]
MAPKYARDQPDGFTNQIERVAIVGAGGQIGSYFVQALLETGKHRLTAITRKYSNTLPKWVHEVEVDYDDEATLVHALQDQQFLIITMAVTAPAGTQSKIIRAAAKAGVPYVMPSWYGADIERKNLLKDLPIRADWTNVTEEISSLGVSSWIAYTTGFWYEFSLLGAPDAYGFDIKNRHFTIIDDGDVAINTSTYAQCGRGLAKLLSLKELPEDESDRSKTLSQFRNSTLYVSSFRLTQRDMFDSLKRVTGTDDADWTISNETSAQRWRDGRDELQSGQYTGFIKQLYSRIFFPGGDGDYETTPGTHNAVLGLPKEDLDEATRRSVEIFGSEK